MTRQHSVEEWKSIAERYRPWVELCRGNLSIPPYTKYVEDYYPSNVSWYLNQCYLRLRSNGDFRLRSPTPEQLLEHNHSDAYLEPFNEGVYIGDPAGAPYYVHIFAVDPHVVQIQYWFFYAYNGDVPLVVRGSLGHHEGDWEHVDVRVDLAQDKILAMYFASHGSAGDWLTRSTTGEPDSNTFQLRDGRPVAFSAWHSHASYPDKGVQLRSIVIAYDVTTGGDVWNGRVELIYIDPSLLPKGVPSPEPAWLRWVGRWGSTVDEGHSYLPNSPDGPRQGKAWGTSTEAGVWWPKWEALANVPPLDEPRWTEVASAVPAGGVYNAVALTSNGKAWWTYIDRKLKWKLPPQDIGGEGLSCLALNANGAGSLTALAFNATGRLVINEQLHEEDRATWSGWTQTNFFGFYKPYLLAVAPDRRGRLHALVSYQGALRDNFQINPGVQQPWTNPFAILSGDISRLSALPGVDGVLVVAAQIGGEIKLGFLGDDEQWTFDVTLTPPSGYSLAALAINSDGRLEAFAVNPELKDGGNVRHCFQTSASDRHSWYPDWLPLGDKNVAHVIAGAEANGAIFVFGWQSGGDIWMTRQSGVPAISWSDWQHMGSKLDVICAAPHLDGRLEAMGINMLFLVHRWENAPLWP